MRLATEVPLSHRERLTQGLAHTAAGPVDVARGAAGLGGAAVRRAAVELRRRYRDSGLADRVVEAAEAAARELARAQETAHEVVAGLPERLPEAPQQRGIGRSWVIAGAIGAALLVGGAVAVLLRQQSNRPAETSPRPPSVETQPKI